MSLIDFVPESKCTNTWDVFVYNRFEYDWNYEIFELNNFFHYLFVQNSTKFFFFFTIQTGNLVR